MKAVSIKDLIEEMDIQSEVYSIYFNKVEGTFISISNEAMSIAEDLDEEDGFSEYMDWQQDEIKEAIEVLMNRDNYIAIPSRFDINEYLIMEKFCYSIDNDRVSNSIQREIQCRGAFRRFKDAVIRYNIEKKWYGFKEESYKKIAIDWCEYNCIDYIK